MNKKFVNDEIKRKIENLTPFEKNTPNTKQQRDALKAQLVDYLSGYDGFEIEVQGGSSEAEVNVLISTDNPILAAMLEEMKGMDEE